MSRRLRVFRKFRVSLFLFSYLSLPFPYRLFFFHTSLPSVHFSFLSFFVSRLSFSYLLPRPLGSHPYVHILITARQRSNLGVCICGARYRRSHLSILYSQTYNQDMWDRLAPVFSIHFSMRQGSTRISVIRNDILGRERFGGTLKDKWAPKKVETTKDEKTRLRTI